MNTDLEPLIQQLIESYTTLGGINHIDGLNLPHRRDVIEIAGELLALVFPGFFGSERLTSQNFRHITGHRVIELHARLTEQIERSLCYACKRAPVCQEGHCAEKAVRCATWMIERLPDVRRVLKTDVDAAFRGDPACYSHEEAIGCYPGVLAIAVQRLAHILYEYRVPLLPRIMTEYAHSRTGIDIHPGATIGEGFFIDHGTGVVIGETCVIGKHVKLYQGVTLGALSFEKDDQGRLVKGIKRHPDVEDHVVIYAGATILGGRTRIGAHSEVGGNVWLTHSVPPHSKVYNQQPRPLIREKDGSWKTAEGPWNDLGAGI